MTSKTRQRREHDDDREGCGAAYVSTFRWGEGRTSIRRLLSSAYVSTFDGEGLIATSLPGQTEA